MKIDLIKAGIFPLLIAAAGCSTEKPNVLFIMSDDLNDWVGAFGGNRQVLTPNMDRFCADNAMVFMNAHAPGPLCCPSRSAMLSGFRPERTGCYSNPHNMRQSELVQKYATMPEYFSKNGYITISKGKIFHTHQTETGRDGGQWAFDLWEGTQGNFRVQSEKLWSRFEGLYNGVKRENMQYEHGALGSKIEWGPTRDGKEKTSDYMTAQWFASQLEKDFDKPFFMAVGFSKPHLPWFIPQEYFDRYDPDTLKIPDYRMDDLDDILKPLGEKKFKATDDFLWFLQDEDLHREGIRAYMASISYVDECIGVVLDALKKSRYSSNTIVVIMGDHGWHLGEKLKIQKNTLWSESTRTPLIIRTPGMKKSTVCRRVVNLIDMYPTLAELCGLPERELCDGRSIVPLLKDPQLKWDYPSITTFGAHSLTVNDEQWRYTTYADGTQELYNLQDDPMEWVNLITSKDEEAVQAKTRLEKWIPEKISPELPRDKIGSNDTAPVSGPDTTIRRMRMLQNLR